MQTRIMPATAADSDTICQLFEQAIAYQKEHNYIGWESYDKLRIEKDIDAQLLFKILSNDQVVGIFTIYYSDPLIWREMEKNDAIYIHRVVLNRKFQGIKLFKLALDWTMEHARERGLNYIRIDTWAANEKIISYYKNYGFRFIENYTTGDTEELPVPHRNLNVTLLELAV
ncbi:GNAT family N-acetyltransferase [Lacibacter sp. H375]|uniref:GNAT family N-acetyltransferase n=1 Tax=Lacibacter sp. H375 TaxID=3133424 RepID=UPI0030BCEEF0